MSSHSAHAARHHTNVFTQTADWCEYFTTAVRTRGKPGDASGISMLLIERTEGVRTKRMSMGGQWSAGTSTVTFEDVKVPVENLLGKENGMCFMLLHHHGD